VAGLRNGPVDRRYLSDQDNSDYQRGGGFGERSLAKARAQGRRGNISYQANRPISTTISKEQGKARGRAPETPGFGDFTRYGAESQRQRMIDVSQEKERAESFRPTKMSMPDIYQ